MHLPDASQACGSANTEANRRRSVTDPERVADDYASDLLLPRYLLEPMLTGLPRPTLKAVEETAEAFDASLTPRR